MIAAFAPPSKTLPAVLIIGAQKAGTTTIHRALSESGRFALSAVKEPQYFALEEHFVHQHTRHYLNLFHGERPILDASTMYLASASACKFAAAILPDARIIVCSRSVADRAISAYAHQRRKGSLIERRSFSAICEDLLNRRANAADLLRAEQDALEEALQRRVINPDYYTGSYFSYLHPHASQIGLRLADPLQPLRYFGNGMVERHVSMWDQAFDSRVCVVDIEEIKNQPDRVIDRLEHFLQMDLHSCSHPDLRSLPHANVAIKPRVGWLGSTYNAIARMGLPRRMPTGLRRVLRKIIHLTVYTRSRACEADIEAARAVVQAYSQK